MSGSALANVLDLGPASPLVQDLKKLTPQQKTNFLTSLRRDWTSRKIGLSIPSYCAYETKKYGRWFAGVTVVEMESAELLCNADLAEVEEHHIDIVKPKNPKNFYSHTLLSNWYKDVFPYAARKGQDSKSPVLVADCANDTYGPEFHAAVSNEIFALTDAPPRLTRKLPRDWRPSYWPLLWQGEAPRVIVIHLSCFANAGGTNDAALNQERTEDFVRFLQSVEHESVKILVYSLAFASGTGFLTKYAAADKFMKAGRLVTYATSHGSAFSADRAQRCRLKATIKQMLENRSQESHAATGSARRVDERC